MGWGNKGIGETVAIIAGADEPPTDQCYRFIKLSAGEAFPGGYNDGVIADEVVSGSFPNVSATGVISDEGSTLDGLTVALTSTEFSSGLRYFARIR